MLQILAELFRKIKSSQKDEQDEAIWELARLLEHSNHIEQLENSSSLRSSGVHSDPTLLCLDEESQREVVEHLNTIIMTGEINPSLLWALGKASAKFGIRPLVNLIEKRGDTFDEEALYQATIALDNFLFYSSKAGKEEVDRLLQEEDLYPFLTRMTQAKDELLRELAKNMVNSLTWRIKEAGVSQKRLVRKTRKTE